MTDSLNLVLREQMRYRKERMQALLQRMLRRRQRSEQLLQFLEQQQCARRHPRVQTSRGAVRT